MLLPAASGVTRNRMEMNKARQRAQKVGSFFISSSTWDIKQILNNAKMGET
jgi:hypothetical protein